MNYLDLKIRGALDAIKYPCIMDIKYDGMPVLVSCCNNLPLLITTEAGISYSLSNCNIMLKDNESAKFIAEWIYGQGKNGAIWPLLSAIHAGGIYFNDKALTSISIKIFDVIEYGTEDFTKKDLIYRKLCLDNAVRPSYLAKSWSCTNKAQILTKAQEIHKEGYEGIVVKNCHEPLSLQTWVKLKSPALIQAKVIKVDIARAEIDYQGHAVGINLPGFPVKVGDLIEVKHYGATTKGSLRNAVAIKKI